MVGLAKLPYASVAASLIAMAIVNEGTPVLLAWPYTQDNLDQYPMPISEHDTVPFWAVVVFGVGLWLVFAAVELFGLNGHLTLKQRLRFALLIGMTMMEIFFVTATLTAMGKYFVAEPRPDFKMRCLGSTTATPTYDSNGNVVCTGSLSVIREGRNAFPSGHASTALCFGTFGALYLLWFVYIRKIHLPWRTDIGCMTVFWYQVSHALFCACLFPLFVGLGVACTRIRDHRHSPADVTAGALLGVIVASLYFNVRIVQEPPEDDCEDMKQCDCGQLYRRLSKCTSATSLLAPTTPISPQTPATPHGHMANTHFNV